MPCCKLMITAFVHSFVYTAARLASSVTCVSALRSDTGRGHGLWGHWWYAGPSLTAAHPYLLGHPYLPTYKA